MSLVGDWEPTRLLVVFDPKTASNSEFSQAALQYSRDIVIAMGICRHIPSVLAPYVL